MSISLFNVLIQTNLILMNLFNSQEPVNINDISIFLLILRQFNSAFEMLLTVLIMTDLSLNNPQIGVNLSITTFNYNSLFQILNRLITISLLIFDNSNINKSLMIIIINFQYLLVQFKSLI